MGSFLDFKSNTNPREFADWRKNQTPEERNTLKADMANAAAGKRGVSSWDAKFGVLNQAFSRRGNDPANTTGVIEPRVQRPKVISPFK